MLRARELLSLAVVTALALPGSAVGQPTPPPSGDPSAKKQALDLFAQSDKAYKAGEFERAAQLLRDAYTLFPEPILLYNLARALEGVGDFQGAIDQYQQYLASATDVGDRGAIERRIDTLRTQLADKAKREAAAQQADKDRQAALAAAEKAERDRRRSKRSILPWVTLGVGVVVVAGGAGMGVLANQKHDDAIGEPIQAEAAHLQDTAESYALGANIMFVAGGAIALGGVIWAIVDRRKHSGDAAPATATSTRLLVGPSSIGVAWSFD
jgi:tetratricopeptide (TPR) repeat protein